MTREIEFRWYDEELDIYFYSYRYFSLSDFFNDFDACASANVLEQYTGLKDKHGNKIFEGDRIRLDLNNEGYKDTVVVYRSDYMQFMFDHPKGVYTMTEYHFKPKDLEIIGNIHKEVFNND